MEKFSVLMSIYKNEKPAYLRKALDSILHQTLMPSEIVMVKDGPLTPALEEVLQEYAKKYDLFKFIPLTTNHGLGLALRAGVPECAYEYIARMDTDDISLPDRFEKQVKYLEDHPDISLLGTWCTEFSQDEDHPDTVTKLPQTNEEIIKYSKKRNPFRHMTVIFRKSAVLDSGNYRHFLWFEDYDLFVRMLYHGYKAANLPEILVHVRADRNMFARRGGITYLLQDFRFQKFLLKIGYIGHGAFLFNLCVRASVRLMPNQLRAYFYQKFLRINKNSP